MQPVLLLGADGAGYTVVIDGVTWRAVEVDVDGRLEIAVAVPFTPTTPTSGQVTVAAAGVRVQLPAVACRAVSIAARPANAGNVFLGDATVAAANGRILAPGDAIDVAIDNTNRLYVDAATNGDGISFLRVA